MIDRCDYCGNVCYSETDREMLLRSHFENGVSMISNCYDKFWYSLNYTEGGDCFFVRVVVRHDGMSAKQFVCSGLISDLTNERVFQAVGGVLVKLNEWLGEQE